MTVDPSHLTEHAEGSAGGPHYVGPHNTSIVLRDHGVAAAGGIHGDIYQASETLSADALRALWRRNAAPPPLNHKSLRTLEQVFVPPSGFDAARAELRASNLVVVAGAYGSGRRSAAMKLLAEASSSCRELTIEEEDEDDQLNPGSLQPGEGILLDLSAQHAEHVAGVLKRGAGFLGTVAAKGCYCAVVVPEDPGHLLTSGLQEHVVTIGRPDARSVFAAHLRKHGIGHDDSDLTSPELVARLEQSTMAELGLLVSRTRDAGDRDELVSRRLERALDAFRTRPGDVSSWIRHRDDEGEHALVLSAAMLAGAHTDAVFAATEALLDVVDSPADRNSLHRRGISERLGALKIAVDADCRVRFERPDFDHQVRTYFWREHPGLREKFRDWIGRTVLDPALNEHTRNDVVVRFAEQVLAVERPGDVWKLVEQWVAVAGENRSSAALGYVAVLLRIGLVDERFGGSFRVLVYRWAKNAPMSSAFDIVLINLCERVIAPSFSQSALVRLRHLARRDDEQVVEEATRRVDVLAKQPLFFRRALNKLAHELRKKDELPDVQLFLRVAVADRVVARGGGLPVVADGAVRGQLVVGWRSAMGRDVSVWEASARGWLDRAIHDSVHGPQLLDVLVEAGGSSADALGRLLGLARRWAREASGEVRRHRSRLVADLRGRIDTSQHLEFLTTAGEKA